MLIISWLSSLIITILCIVTTAPDGLDMVINYHISYQLSAIKAKKI